MNSKRGKVKTGRRKTQPVNTRRVKWDLRLYVAGQTPKSVTALNNLQILCEEQLKGMYHIELIDLVNNPELARDNQILAVPTLIRRFPLPVRNIIGDLSNTERLLVGLDLIERSALRLVDSKSEAQGPTENHEENVLQASAS